MKSIFLVVLSLSALAGCRDTEISQGAHKIEKSIVENAETQWEQSRRDEDSVDQTLDDLKRRREGVHSRPRYGGNDPIDRALDDLRRDRERREHDERQNPWPIHPTSLSPASSSNLRHERIGRSLNISANTSARLMRLLVDIQNGNFKKLDRSEITSFYQTGRLSPEGLHQISAELRLTPAKTAALIQRVYEIVQATTAE